MVRNHATERTGFDPPCPSTVDKTSWTEPLDSGFERSNPGIECRGGGEQERGKLRVKDIDFGYRQLLVRDGKGGKDRVTLLPESVVEPLKAHLDRVKVLHGSDLAAGYGDVELPHALARKYPRAAYEWGWKFVFPSHKRSTGATRSQRNKAGRSVSDLY